MNEMELLTAFRGEVPIAAPSARAEGLFTAGLSEIQGHQRSARVRLALPRVHSNGPGPNRSAGWLGGRRRLSLAGAAIVAAGLTATAIVLAVPHTAGRSAGVPGIAEHTPGPTMPVHLLATIAARAALSQPLVRPSQWVYRKEEFYQTPPPSYVPDSVPAVIIEGTWITADGTRSVFGSASQGTGTEPGPVPYSEIGSLPTDPRVLDAYLAHQVYPRPNATPTNKEVAAFTDISQMLSTMILPPRLTAELYHALADIPGIVAKKNVHDITGRIGVAFLMPQNSQSMNDEIILNARTYQFLGEATWQDGPDVWVKQKGGWTGPDLFSEDAILTESLVAGPGKLP
jgi:hypothetical protein